MKNKKISKRFHIFLILIYLLFFGVSFSISLVSETKVWQTTSSEGDPNIEDPNPLKNVYIDSNYTGSTRNGTITQPYNSWDEVPQPWVVDPSNKTYLFKRGTTNYGTINFLNKENINIGAYGTGNRPKIIYTGDSYAISITFYGNPTLQQNSSTRIVGLDVSATKNADALVRLSSNTIVENCYLHNAQWGIRSTGDPIGQPSNIQNVKIKNSVIEDIADDGIMIQDVNGIIIEDNLIRTVNQNYYLVGTSQQQAAGDGIQFVANANWQLLNNRIDRSDTANKFNFISSYDKSVPPNTAIIEGNTFISPRASSEGGAIFYASNHVGVGYQNTGDGYNVYVINNIFSGALPGTALSAVWYHGENLYSVGNDYKNMTSCLTNRWRENGLPQVPIYSYGDTFIYCSENTIGNVIINSGNYIPIVSKTYVFSGNSLEIGTSGFYKGSIDLRADIYDNIGISGNTCEYTTGLSRSYASYSGTNNSGYCYKENIDLESDLNINFRIRNLINSIGTGSSTYYFYDNKGPDFIFLNNSGYECKQGTMTITNASDIVGLNTEPYNFNLAGRGNNQEINITPHQAGTVIITTGYVRDALGNISVKTGSYTFNNSRISVNDFTGSDNVGNSIKTGNRKILSNASDMWCGSGDISYSGIIIQGTKGTCNISGEIIEYVPNVGETGNDYCTIQIKDNENSIANFNVYRNGIDNIVDYTPDQFSFVNVSGAELNTLYTSNIITITGMSPGLSTGMSLNNGYIIKNGINIGQSGTGGNSDQIILALTSSNNYETIVSSILNVGSTTGMRSVITKSDTSLFGLENVYIDPTYTGINGTENGSIERPFNSWTDFGIQSNKSYFQKRGTIYNSPSKILLFQVDNVRIADYGSGEKPIINYTGAGNFYAIQFNQCTNCYIENMRVTAPTAAGLVAIIGMGSDSGGFVGGSGINIVGCELWKAGSDSSEAMGIRAGGNNIKILNTTIHDISIDGIYARNATGIEIAYSNIYDINRRYFSDSNQDRSSGDGIQLDGYRGGFHIHHTTIDRTNGAGNKFNLILNSAGSSLNASGILEHNNFINDSNVARAVHIEHGSGIITRYNKFMGNTLGIRLGGAGTKNNLIHNNLFYNSSRGIHIGYIYTSDVSPVGPAIGTKIYNNTFYKISNYHISLDKSHVESRNNIHLRSLNDTGVAIYNYGGGSGTISNNCYGNLDVIGTLGSGNNSVIGNPLFVNETGNDFHLQSASPCIDAGTGVGITQDFDGINIPQNGIPDIGAFEYFGEIDNDYPVISGASHGAYYSGQVNIEIIDDNFDGVFVNGNWSNESGFNFTGILLGITSYYLTAVDLAGNASYISFVIDNAPPLTNQISTRLGSWQSIPTTGDQNLILSGVDNGIGIENTWYCIGESMGLTCSPNITGTNVLFTCDTGELCQNKVLYYSKDLLGNIEDIKWSGILTIDKEGPQNIGFDINNGASIVTGTNINLTNITGYDIRGLFYPNTTQIAYGTSSNVNNRTGLSSTKAFLLPNIDGEYTIYMRFRDGGGNISITSGSIILDANAPIITINNPNTNYEKFKTITASTNEGILTMTTGSTNTTCDASRNFIAYSGTTFTSESDNGKYICYRAIDSGGNITYSLSNAIAGIDTTMPVASIISPSSIVGETGIFISVNSNENSQCRYNTSAGINFDSMILLNGTGTSHTGNYTAIEGSNTLYFKCRDVAGNISSEVSYTFTVNLGNPVIQFVLGTTPNNPTNSNSVNIYLTGTDITKYKYKLITGYSCNGVVYDGGEININTSITQGPTTSDQTYSYCAIGFKTGLNVWQITGTKYTFVYDNTSPVITVNDGVNTNWNTGDNINLSIDYNLAGVSGTKYIWSTGLVCNGLNYSSGINYIAGDDIVVENGFYNNFYMCFKSTDIAGNIGYTGVGPFKIDQSSPVTNINDVGSGWRVNNVSFSVSGNDKIISGNILCLDPIISITCALNPEDQACPTVCRTGYIFDGGAGLQSTYYKILTGDVSCGEGNYIEYTTGVNIDISTGSTAIKTVCYYSTDILGNSESYKKQLYKIDKQGPSINLISPLSGGVTGSGTSITFMWSGNDQGIGISGYIFRLYNNSGSLITGINSSNTGISLQGLINGNYYWNVESVDFLGNTGISNTQYFENINQYVVLPNTNNIQDFINEFLNKGYKQSTGNDIWEELITGTLIGNTDIYFGIDNQIRNDVILESSGVDKKISILIDSGSIVIKTGENINSCSDLIYSPVFVDNSIARDLMDEQNIFETFKVGSECENVSLKFVNMSGDKNNIKIRIKSNNLDNDEYKLRYSNDGENRDYLGRYDYDDRMEIDIDHMTYFAISKDKQRSSAGGGAIKLVKDDCKYSSQKKNLPGANEKGIDYSDSYYDKDCRGNQHGITLDGDISGSQFSDELNYAYLYSYQIGITTMPHINQADMMGSLIRKHMAKMISNYALNELGIKANESRVCNFTDIENESAEMGYYINLACQLGLMGLKSDGTPDSKFNPNAVVTRSQFGTALSRLLYGEEFNVGKNEVWYSKHLNNLKSKNIMNKIDNPGSHEKRGYVMLMLMRAKTLR